ncbi:MAG: EboA domain-containing protein, partial [Myxococcota bacterium]
EVRMPACDALLAIVRARLDRPELLWLDDALTAAASPDPRAFRAEWSRVGRRTGTDLVVPTAEETDRLRVAGAWPLLGWGLDECVRAVLLLRAMRASEKDTHVALARSLYLRGTIRERQALLRALAWLPDAGRFADLAAEATRTHVVSVFESIAVANPYPGRWLVRPIFDQMVAKAMAFRIPPERILGLADRATPEAARLRVPRPTPHPALPALLAP